MVDALVQTKLLFPRPRPTLVERARLTDVLERARDASLVLVSAPAGFGKTTMVAAALRRRTTSGAAPHAVAWVSLDARDGDATRFWAYALRALDGALPGCAAAALGLLEVGQPDLEDVLTLLVNELSVRADDVTLVLDDYHLADTEEVSESVTFLLHHQPQQLHLVISTRADPALPLARLRARGDLVEVRAADLRFTTAEAGSYLNAVHDLDLSTRDVEALESRTEGWVAALQLAALSLQGRDDATDFIASFAGDDRFVVDYLVDEVLDQQPAALRDFLLDTSVLDRLCGELCDALTEGDGGRTVLEALERRNLLLVPLDDRRHWYRYHHLFADVLQSRLLAERPDDVALLHRRASLWYEQAGHVEAAVRHAFAAGDADRAADLIELAAPSLRRERAEQTLVDWIAQVPPEVLRRRPVLAIAHVAALMAGNVYDGVAERLDALEADLATPPGPLVVRDREEWERLPALVETQRAGLALVAGDLDATIVHADAALARAAGGDQLTVAAASALAGLASWSVGDVDSAHASYATATAGLAAVGHVSDVMGCTVTLVDLELQRGHLDSALRAARDALGLARADGVPVRGTADVWVASSRVAWQRGDDATAEAELSRAADLGEAAGLPQQPYRWRVAMAELREVQGDLASAEVLLREAERLFNSDFSPVVRPVPAVRARLRLRAGDLAAAREWADAAGVQPDDETTYLREHEHLTLVRLLLAEHARGAGRAPLDGALDLVRRVHDAAEAAGRTAVVLETLVLLAIAGDAAGRTAAADSSLRQAVDLARPQGWVRPFLDEGAALRRLLPRHRALDPFLAAALGATSASAGRPRPGPGSRRPAHPDIATTPALVVPLSSRELEVLRLLASDLDGPAIARHLSVSLATVRTHTQHVYAKLGVNNRRAAVRRGHQLNL